MKIHWDQRLNCAKISDMSLLESISDCLHQTMTGLVFCSNTIPIFSTIIYHGVLFVSGVFYSKPCLKLVVFTTWPWLQINELSCLYGRLLHCLSCNSHYKRLNFAMCIWRNPSVKTCRINGQRWRTSDHGRRRFRDLGQVICCNIVWRTLKQFKIHVAKNWDWRTEGRKGKNVYESGDVIN